MNSVIHFEIPFVKSKRLKDFYTKVFGWRMMDAGSDMGDYILAQTAKTDDKGMIETPGAINGGFFPKTEKTNTPLVVIGVENINDAMKKIINEGGEILGEPTDITNVGKYVAFIDSEGNRLAILEPISI